MLWNILSYAAWGMSALVMGWMLYDTLTIRSRFSEDLLLSSREGADEMVERIEEESA